jgi:hypothetical protein
VTADRTPDYPPSDRPDIVGRLLQDGALNVAALTPGETERLAKFINEKWSDKT